MSVATTSSQSIKQPPRHDDEVFLEVAGTTTATATACLPDASLHAPRRATSRGRDQPELSLRAICVGITNAAVALPSTRVASSRTRYAWRTLHRNDHLQTTHPRESQQWSARGHSAEQRAEAASAQCAEDAQDTSWNLPDVVVWLHRLVEELAPVLRARGSVRAASGRVAEAALSSLLVQVGLHAETSGAAT